MTFGPNGKALRYLTAVTASGSVRGAADRCNVEPSVVSRQISLLEADLGVQLLERRGRGVVVTEAAEIVLAYCRERVAGDHSLRAQLDELGGVQRGVLHIVAGDGFMESLLEMVLRPFCQQHPRVRIILEMAGASDTVRAVAEERCQLGVNLAGPANAAVRILHSVPQPVRLVCSPEHSLAGHPEPIPVAALQGHSLAIAFPGTALGTIVRRAADAAGVELSPSFSANTIVPLKRFATLNIGATFLTEPAMYPEIAEGTLVSRRVDSSVLESCTAQLMVREGRELSAAVKRLLTFFEQANFPSIHPVAPQI